MALPAYATWLANLKGEPGEPGPAGTIASATGHTIPAGEPARVEMSGPETAKHLDVFIPEGLPGQNVVENDEAMATRLKDQSTQSHDAVRVLGETRTGVVSAADFGVKMDSSTDDTAAWQALVDGAPRGSTVVLPASRDGARWSVISSTIVVTTPNLRIVGPGKDPYYGGVRLADDLEVAFRIETHGVDFENISFTGTGSALGQDTKTTVLDYWGTKAGDVDGAVKECGFLYVKSGIVTHGRNLSVTDSIFSNATNAVTFLPKDDSYHTEGPAIVRGMIVKRCRFHAIGATNGDGAVVIREHTDFRHGEISGNYFDAEGRGIGIVAAGSSSARPRGLRIGENTFQQMAGPAISLTFIDTFQIASNFGVGTGSGSSMFDGVLISNCVAGEITSTYLNRIGRSGFVLRNSSQIRLNDCRVQLAGNDSETVGHGFDVDSTNSAIQIIDAYVQGTDGWGVVGSPPDSLLQGGTFVSCTLGRVSSTTFREPSVIAHPTAFAGITGSPAIGNANSNAVMMFDPAVQEQVTTFIGVPGDWRQFDLELWWVAPQDTAGTVRWQVFWNAVTAGAQLPSGSGTTRDTPVQTGVTNRVHREVIFSNISAPASGEIGVRVIRVGNASQDDYPADAGLLAVKLVKSR